MALKFNPPFASAPGRCWHGSWLVALLLFTVSMAVFAWSVVRADAAWQFLAARSITEAQLAAAMVSEDAVETARRRVQRALQWFPANPDYLDLAGQLRELSANQPGVVGAERRALLHAAADYYRRAISVRPLWPYSWASLLGVKDRLGEVDGEFHLALARSDELGPWEPQVQLQLLEAGLRHWDELGQGPRARVQRKLAAAVTVQPREVFALVRGFGRADLLCAIASGQPQIEAYCTDWHARQKVS